jgi:hypothetical protein
MIRIPFLAVTLALAGCTTTSSGPIIRDAETRAWWALTTALSSDAMEGRDTGSAGYDRAAAFVADRFRAAGLRPAGDGGSSFFQPIRMHELRVEEVGTSFELVDGDGGSRPLRFLHDLTIGAAVGLPAAIDAPLSFRGYCRASDLAGIQGKVAICFNSRRAGLATGAERVASVTAAGAAGIVQIDDPSFTVEPPRWPSAYARAVTPVDALPDPPGVALPLIRYNPQALPQLLVGSGRDAATLLAAGGRGEPLTSFDVPARLRATISIRSGEILSANVLAVLPGTDPELRGEYLVVGAHLDGYGYGTPIEGDGLYNGTFDDAAYVATLIRLAEQRRGRGYRRSILFAVFTGEEKGLIGSRWLIAHPPVPREAIVGMINLDQLRPIFPLDILTVHALEDSSIGQAAREIAAAMNIRTRLDPEPERNLITRADHWPFLQADIPAVNFVFGYEAGTEAERRYRLWYRTRYHHPADDSSQPWDPEAAARMNEFFYRLSARVADAEARPVFLGPNPHRARTLR